VRHAHAARLTRSPVPIYDYLCSNCRHLTEVIHGIHEAGPRFCPACGADGTMRKAMSTPTVHFKGSGWAKKDRSSATASRTKAAAASTSSSDGTSGDVSSATEKSVPATEPAQKSAETTGSSED
jgi:putative FmdB family regulatory protein